MPPSPAQIEQWRTARIRPFKERQRRTREWINFAEIAEWCSKEDQSIVPNNQKRVAALDTLASDLLAGEFEENGRSRVLYLNPASKKARMTSKWLQEVIAFNYDGQHGRSEYLPCCWIPRHLFDRWRAKHRLPKSPQHFEPDGGKVSVRLKKSKSGRPVEYKWEGVKAKLAHYVLKHGHMRTSAELLQKCADFATDLHSEKKRQATRRSVKPSRSTPSTLPRVFRKYTSSNFPELRIAPGGVRPKSA